MHRNKLALATVTFPKSFTNRKSAINKLPDEDIHELIEYASNSNNWEGKEGYATMFCKGVGQNTRKYRWDGKWKENGNQFEIIVTDLFHHDTATKNKKRGFNGEKAARKKKNNKENQRQAKEKQEIKKKGKIIKEIKQKSERPL